MAAKAIHSLVDRKPESKRFKDLTGQRFGKLTVTGFAGFQGENPRWHATCDCGRNAMPFGGQLSRGKAMSCGCVHYSLDGLSRLPEYGIWKGMVSRCNDQSDADYGGRGISVCERWKSFRLFLLDMGRRPTPLHSIDRIDNEGNYCKSNCRWATKETQARNRRNVRTFLVDGKELCIPEIAKRLGISKQALHHRLRTMPASEAISLPKNPGRARTNFPQEASA